MLKKAGFLLNLTIATQNHDNYVSWLDGVLIGSQDARIYADGRIEMTEVWEQEKVKNYKVVRITCEGETNEVESYTEATY